MSKRVDIRMATPDDVDGILELNERIWDEFPATREMIAKRIEIFPEGNYIAIDPENGKIVGSLCLMFLGHGQSEFPSSWMEITGDGTIRTHNPDGKYMYGVSLTADKGYSAGMKLQIYGWVTIIKYRRRGCYLGSPIPGFAEFKQQHPDVSVEDYVFRMKGENGGPLDPELSYYHNAGFRPVRVLENYEPDSKSLDYGVLIYVNNIFYHWPCRSLIAWLVKKFGFRLLKALGI